ncbi:MAG: hypothetical protein U0O22_08720 [Acutalibacteraceae bacterium]
MNNNSNGFNNQYNNQQNNQYDYYSNQSNNPQQNFNPNFDREKQKLKGFSEKAKEFLLNTSFCQDRIESKDVQDNRLLCILSYLGIFMLIPFFVRRDSRYVRFHCNQGLVLFIFSIILSIAKGIINGIIGSIFAQKATFLWFSFTTTNPFGSFLQSIVNIVFAIPVITLIVVGIYNTIKGRVNELPIIGRIRLIKTIRPITTTGSAFNNDNNTYNSTNNSYNDYNGYNNNEYNQNNTANGNYGANLNKQENNNNYYN